MWRAVVGWLCGAIGLAVIASTVVAPASAGTATARVPVADYVQVAEGLDPLSPEVESNVRVSVEVRASGYDVTPR